MSYLVIARKWRPQRFDDLIGQEPIQRLLKNSIEHGHVAHAYIFSGPRGVGKTSTARILAKALNCQSGPTATPCGSCPSCISIKEGSSIDVMEIDGASNNSVDDIRNLREQVKYAPSEGRYKVYIIDEVHMLSTSAFNALLKTLEEPPPHVIFVLATTAPKKIPLTVISRCQHMPFRTIPSQKIKERLRLIADSEGIKISEHGLDMLARAADGSMRDALTILDQIASSTAEIEESDIKDILGSADFDVLMDITEAIINANREKIIEIIQQMTDKGEDPRAFAKDLTKFLRDILVSKLTPNADEILDISKEELNSLKNRLPNVSADFLTLLLSEMIKTESDVRLTSNPRIALEMSLLKISYLGILKPIKEAIANIEGFTPPTPPTAAEDSKISNSKPEIHNTEDSEITGDCLLKLITEKLNDPVAASKLSKATLMKMGDTITLSFEKQDSDICAEPIRENLLLIQEIASSILNSSVNIEIDITSKKTLKKKDIKEKIMSEPLIKEVIELFDGRIVDVKGSESPNKEEV